VDAFSYLSVLLSIILGLGVTQVLTAVGRLIRHRDRVRMDWLPLVWAAVMLLIFVQVWWSMFGLRTYRDWTFFGFLLVLLQTCTLYMMAALVLPEQIEETSVDLAAHYDRQHRWFFGFLLATLVISVCKDLALNGHWPSAINLGFHFIMATTCLAGIFVRGRRFHQVIGAMVPAGMVVYIALLFMRLQ
jgi:hypothetical protein